MKTRSLFRGLGVLCCRWHIQFSSMAVGLLLQVSNAVGAELPCPQIQVEFSPNGGCTETVVNVLNRASKSVLVQAYSFTSAPIAKALVEAHRRGVQVLVILDKSQRTEKYSSARFLANQGIETLIDDKHAIAHNKVMVIDSARIITGSFNFTKAAEQNNAENLLLIDNDPELVAKYIANWKKHQRHSVPYEHAIR